MTFAGCSATGPSTLEFGLRRVATTDRAKILTDAEAILAEMGFVLLQRDADAGVLLCADTKSQEAVGADRYRFTSDPKQRRIVEVRVQSVPDGLKLFARVSIQQQTTQAHRAIAFDAAGDDRPGHTAIDRDAATTTDQNTTWQTTRRDKPTEQKILTAITNRIDNVAPSESG